MIVQKIENVIYDNIINNPKYFSKILDEEKMLAISNIDFESMLSPEEEARLYSQTQEIPDYRVGGSIKGVMQSISQTQFSYTGVLVNGHTNETHRGAKKIYGSDYNDQSNSLFILSHWHVDDSPLDEDTSKIPFYICMHMKTFRCDKEKGVTIFVDREKMLQDMDRDLLLEVAKYQVFPIPKNNFSPDEISGDYPTIDDVLNFKYFFDNDKNVRPMRVYPSVSCHNITGKFSLTVHSTAMLNVLLCTDSGLRDEYSRYVDSYLMNESNWIKMHWEENDFLMWDNTNLIHSFSGGWSDDDRSFDRADAGLAEIYFNYENFLENKNPL